MIIYIGMILLLIHLSRNKVIRSDKLVNKRTKQLSIEMEKSKDLFAEVKCGSGLGLTITKHIIDLYNGEIFIESELNKGSKFRIILKIKIK